MQINIIKEQISLLCKEIALLSHTYPIKIVTAESCTAGLLSASLADLAGASQYLEGGFITYSNLMKHSVLNVSKEMLDTIGAVSEEVAIAMTQGALDKACSANFAVAVTGIAGPDGGSSLKPVGLVWIAVQHIHHDPVAQHFLLKGDRNSIRLQTVMKALTLLKQIILSSTLSIKK